MQMFLVLIETSGNQNFIFSTNKLKENFGASEQTYRAGTEWVLHAVKRLGSKKLWDNDAERLRKNLLDSTKNSAIEKANTKVEVMVASSGKALLLTKDEQTAQKLIKRVTRTALKVAPGLDICGVYEEFDWANDSLGEVNERVHKKFAEVRARRPSPEMRFLRLPVVADCRTSAWPASCLETMGDEMIARSQVTLMKRKFSRFAFTRMQALLDRRNLNIDLAASLSVLDKEDADSVESPNSNRGLDWFAVVHADGNGLGEIILKFESHLEKLRDGENVNLNPEEIKSANNRQYVNNLRAFSIGLDICTENAFIKALDTFIKPSSDSDTSNNSSTKKVIPLVPLVLGGDDLTVICDGQKALLFTHAFLREFERQTEKQIELSGEEVDLLKGHETIISDIAKVALGANRLSACAGIAIIKPHFPFSEAYELSEALMQSAKTIKKKIQNPHKKDNPPWPCSSLDFHIVYDASGVEFKQIRQKLEVDKSQTKLYASPYIVTPQVNLETAKGTNWAKLHRWEALVKRVKAITEKEEEKRKLPNSQMHELRTALFLGSDEADARLKLIWQRYQDKGLTDLVEIQQSQPPSLFWSEKEGNNEQKITGFLDALDAANFMAGEVWKEE